MMVLAIHMGKPRMTDGGRLSHAVSFLLGALVPTLLLFFLASDRVGEQLPISISSFSAAHLQLSSNLSTNSSAAEKEESFPGLAELLPKVATDDRMLIITSVNEAWAAPGSLLDLFRQSFRDGEGIAHLLDHTLIVAVDLAAMDRCRAVHPHCYLLQIMSANVSSANSFMTKSYLEIVWAKLALQQRVLELGYNYLFTDVDIMWFRNPFRHISLYADMSVATDYRPTVANTGFYYVKSNNRTVEMLKVWRAARWRFRSTHDQDVFNYIRSELAGGQLQIKFVSLEASLFDTFCQLRSKMETVCTMHGNCCVGLKSKVLDLRNVAEKWKNYVSLTLPEKSSSNHTWNNVSPQCAASMKRKG